MKHYRTSFAASVLFAIASCGTQKASFVGERTTALDASTWESATWLSVSDAPVVTGRVDDGDNGRSASGISWFVTTVTNTKKVVAARWMTTSLGVFDLYVNGQPVGEEVLRPGFTHPEKTRRSFTYDITRAFRRKAGAENVLAVQVAPGWWADKIVTPGGHEGMVGQKCAFCGVLQLTFADGTQQLLGTDKESWRAAVAGPVRQAGIFEGEAYDARELPAYLNTAKLSVPEVNTEFKGDILPTNGAEIYLRQDLALSPVRAYVWKDIEGQSDAEYGRVVISREYASGQLMRLEAGETLVLDFGQNAAAVPSYVFKGDAGTILTCLPGELLNDGNGARSRGMDGPEGSVHRDNLRTHRIHMRLEYTFAGGDYETFLPRNTFFGYRFASITTTGPVTIKSVHSIPVTSIAADLETGIITTGNKRVNRLIDNIIWGQRSNYLSVPTDCPQRNERQGWTADTQVFAETGTFFANTDAFFHKWMRDMRDTQSPEGGYPGVAPWGQYGDAGMMRVGWADAGIIVPWTIWKQFGDTDIINENWESMLRYMTHINETRYDHNVLSAENGNYQWADWLSYEPLESCSGIAFEHGKPKPDAIDYWNYLSASYWAIDAGMMADMAAATGRNAAPYREMQVAARAYLRSTFLNADGTFKTDILNTMQTPALFALKNELVEGVAREALIARLRRNFVEHDNCLQTGFLGTSILMPTLTANGMTDVAYELLFQRRNPSWLYSVDNGATTIWERWNSYMADKGMGPQGMNSFNHYAYGCVGQWLWESVAGIAADSAKPGFRHIIMRPVPDRRLGHVKAEYHSAAGLIKSAWRFNGDQWTWQFTIPDGATATVTLPGESVSREYVSGSYKVTKQINN